MRRILLVHPIGKGMLAVGKKPSSAARAQGVWGAMGKDRCTVGRKENRHDNFANGFA